MNIDNTSRRIFIQQSAFALAAVLVPENIVSAMQKKDTMKEQGLLDVIIIGGSYAGLSAGMALGRSLRKTLIIDSGMPCNRQTPHSHNFLTQDGKTPQDIALQARKDLENYKTVQVYNDTVVGARKTNDTFEIMTLSGKPYRSKKIIFATGIKDIMPAIPGFSECWGISVIHCPYCHGYEYHGQKTGIMANGDRAFHLASLVSNLTSQLTILTNGKAEFNEEQRAKLHKHAINLIETPVIAIEHQHGKLKKVVLADQTSIGLDALYASVPFLQHTPLAESLGCEMTEQGYIKVDSFQKTTLPGVFACGDNCFMLRSVANAVASGNLAGAMVNKELVDDQF
jgi:thioredoxin reductase